MRAVYNPEPDLPVMHSIPEREFHDMYPSPRLLKPKSHKHRTEYYKDRYREQSGANYVPFHPLRDDYQVDMARVRGVNRESSVLRPPELDDQDNLSQASSSIFADLADKEEESTIWGDLEDNDKGRINRQQQEHRRRQFAAKSTDESEQYGEILLPPHTPSFHLRRRPIFDDIESTGGGITAGGGDFFADPLSMCVFLQDLVTHDCASFFKY